MPAKTFVLTEIGNVKIIKRRGNRNIRLSFDASGNLRVSLPAYAPYRAGLAFVRQKQSWITAHRPVTPAKFASGQIIAGDYQLIFHPTAVARAASARVKAGEIKITFPISLAITSDEVQRAAARGVKKAIQRAAEATLPDRLAELAGLYGYSYKKVKIKPLQRRWGSCDAQKNITLNSYLVQLAPELIDYVLVHELVHTKFQHHQADFWTTMEQHLPDVKRLRKLARASQPG